MKPLTFSDNDPMIEWMDSRIEHYLTEETGKFCVENLRWINGIASQTHFRKYLRILAKKGTLIEEKDELGRFWYSRPVQEQG